MVSAQCVPTTSVRSGRCLMTAWKRYPAEVVKGLLLAGGRLLAAHDEVQRLRPANQKRAPATSEPWCPPPAPARRRRPGPVISSPAGCAGSLDVADRSETERRRSRPTA